MLQHNCKCTELRCDRIAAATKALTSGLLEAAGNSMHAITGLPAWVWNPSHPLSHHLRVLPPSLYLLLLLPDVCVVFQLVLRRAA